MLHATLLLLMLGARYNGYPRITISLKRSTQNLSTNTPADDPIFSADSTDRRNTF